MSEWYVEDHLCEVHKDETEKELEEGLTDFLDGVGFGSQYEMCSIQQTETCDYISRSGQGSQPCGKKASYAKYVLETFLLCTEHAADMGYDTENNVA